MRLHQHAQELALEAGADGGCASGARKGAQQGLLGLLAPGIQARARESVLAAELCDQPIFAALRQHVGRRLRPLFGRAPASVRTIGSSLVVWLPVTLQPYHQGGVLSAGQSRW